MCSLLVGGSLSYLILLIDRSYRGHSESVHLRLDLIGYALRERELWPLWLWIWPWVWLCLGTRFFTEFWVETRFMGSGDIWIIVNVFFTIIGDHLISLYLTRSYDTNERANAFDFVLLLVLRTVLRSVLLFLLVWGRKLKLSMLELGLF